MNNNIKFVFVFFNIFNNKTIYNLKILVYINKFNKMARLFLFRMLNI